MSIIIPVYNTEAFLVKCLDSILNQPAPLGTYEIIIVDDGSPDNSGEIIAEFEAKYSNICVLHQVNSGLGAARNAGLEKARGKYIWFVDSDDFIMPVKLIKILHILSGRAPNVLVLDAKCTDDAGRNITWLDLTWSGSRDRFLGGSYFYEANHLNSYIWAFIFHRSLFVERGVRFLPRINMQDSEILPRLLQGCDRVLISNILAYAYVKRSDSFTNSRNRGVRGNHFSSVIQVHERLKDFCAEVPGEDILMKRALRKKGAAIRHILFSTYLYDSSPEEYRTTLLSMLKTQKLFPFQVPNSAIQNRTIYTRILIFLTNRFPLWFPKVFEIARALQRKFVA